MLKVDKFELKKQSEATKQELPRSNIKQKQRSTNNCLCLTVTEHLWF